MISEKLVDIKNEVDTQSELISRITSALDGKVAGGGSGDADWNDFIDDPTGEIFARSATQVRPFALYNCENITNVYIDNATKIGMYAFYQCSKLGTVYAPNVTSLGNYAFRDSSLSIADFPVAENIGGYTFSGTQIASVNLPNVRRILNSYCFSYCKQIQEINLPSLYSMGTSCTNTFDGCTALRKLNLGELEYLTGNNFNNCTSLEELDLGASITTIASNGLRYLTVIKKIIIRTPTVCSYYTTSASYDPTSADYRIYVPRALVDSYKTATNWSRLADKFVALEDYTNDGTTTGNVIS